MRHIELLLSVSVAALALVSCNKQDTAPELQGPERLKTIEVSLENVVLTKSAYDKDTDAISAGDQIVVNDFQLFLLDGNGKEYFGMGTDGSTAAQSYWYNELPLGEDKTVSFHYVDPNCTKVVAVANMGERFDSYAALLTELENNPIEIGDQQNPENLALYAEDDSFDETGTHVDEGKDTDGNTVKYQQKVYKVELNLKPRISRFEVDGFSVKYKDPANPKYKEVNITQLAFQNYYPETSLVTGTEAGELVNHVTDFANQAAVYTWLDTPVTPQPWFRDYVDLDITPADPVQDLPSDRKLAYHIFSSAAVPQFIIKLTADGQPAFLYTKNFKDSDNNPVTEFKEGHIYRMSGQGEAGPGSDGTIEIPEEKIDPMDRCLEITVTVMEWQVDIITPEF